MRTIFLKEYISYAKSKSRNKLDKKDFKVMTIII